MKVDAEHIERIQEKLESFTRGRWFILLFIVLECVIPPYASSGYQMDEIGIVIGHILSHALVGSLIFLSPIFKILPIVLIISVILLGNRVKRHFNVYVAISYILFAFLQSISITEELGLGIIISNFIMFLMVAAIWLWDAVAQKNDFAPREIPLWRWWVVPLALLAFWYPVNLETLMPDFNPIYLLTSPAGLAFCMMTPVYLAILTLCYPRVNIATLRITSLAGMIIGFFNMWYAFGTNPALYWWNGVLLSIYGLVLSLKYDRTTRESVPA